MATKNKYPDSNEVSEKEIIVNIRNGDVKSFKLLFDSYYSKLCEFVIGFVRSSEVAEDVVQDLFLKVWDQRYKWYPGGSVRSFLFKCARNAAIDYLRKQKIRKTYMAEIYVDIEDDISKRPDRQLENEEIQKRLRRVLDGLSERQRTVFILNRIYDLTYREIADIHGISIKTVETHMGRALKVIREELIEKNRELK